ncbi:MAG: RecQ family zinc-binding domain-containing protein, partial [Actinomycetota bacterium]
FESVSLPSEEICLDLLNQLDHANPTSLATLEVTVNLGRSRLGTLLNILEVDGAIRREGSGWIRTDRTWRYDHQLAEALRNLRRAEASQMERWAELDDCRLRYLREALDDTVTEDCGRCDNCTTNRWQRSPDATLIGLADERLRSTDLIVEPRRQWPSGLGEPKGRIKPEHQLQPGRALARLGDGGWHLAVADAIDRADAGAEPDLAPDLIDAVARILKRWDWEERPRWICPLPSRRRAALVDLVADRLGSLGKLPVHRAVVSVDDDGAFGYQADQANSAHQVTNVWGRFSIDRDALPPADVAGGPVLLLDDEADSRWTLTVAGHLLREAGAGPVLPFVLRTR